ncbi:type I-F CRISPR-associated endoribonuclease Cas6/Csy4 [Gilliamella sp. BG7]|uniref:type I-F CRISPR-associated endoribonuclease Cas6/Csy4 n=1 Tax=unclassified Gilliamella TaxID=2685620 RepID=UPI003986AD86
MLSHYFELRVISQIEITEVEVINQVMQSLHQILVNQKGNIAISFPCYKLRKTVGGVIRLFGSEQELQKIKIDIQQKSSISDYALLTSVAKVPSTIKGYLRFRRFNPKNKSSLRRAEERLTAQGKWTPEVKNRLIEKWGNGDLQYPYFHLNSKSTEQRFILWLKREKCSEPVQGIFNSYGLSQTATVPDF